MLDKELDKYIKQSRKSKLYQFKKEILYLHNQKATLKSIANFLSDKGIEVSISNLSRWIKRQLSKKQKVIKVKIEEEDNKNVSRKKTDKRRKKQIQEKKANTREEQNEDTEEADALVQMMSRALHKKY